MQKAPMGGIQVLPISFIYSVSYNNVFCLCLSGVALRDICHSIFSIKTSTFAIFVFLVRTVSKTGLATFSKEKTNLPTFMYLLKIYHGIYFNATPDDIQSTLDISKLLGLFFTSSNYPKCKLIWILHETNVHFR